MAQAACITEKRKSEVRGEHYICECCGRHFLGDVYHLRVTMTSAETGEEYDFNKENDLCEDCARKLSKWKPKGPIKSRMDTKKKLDHGKAYVLKRQGWTNKQIGDEFGISEKTVSRALASIYKEMAEGKTIVDGVNGTNYSGVQGRGIDE